VPSTIEKDPFVLTVREIRGVKSNGMLASPAELGLSENHDGILEIDVADVGEELMVPGTLFKNLYGLDDVIIDCENKMFTHRPDCFGTLGVAREIAGIFGDAYTSPKWYTFPVDQGPESRFESDKQLQISVENPIPELVPRFMMQAVSGLSVGPSPMWLQAYLARVGIKSINNVVDYSNYFMMVTGQPTHAFDYDKLVSESRVASGEQLQLSPRQALEGEKLALLNGKTIELHKDDIVIDANGKAVALAGVMGGSETEVDETTKTVVIECATFDMYTIRRTNMRHGLFTDAVTRYTKGQSPLQNDRVLAKYVDEIVRFAGGKVASQMFDICDESNVERLTSKVAETDVNFINSRLGSDLTSEQIKSMLENVEFGVEILQSGTLRIASPFWRMDIDLPEDIVEEIGRLYGYDKLPVVLPPRPSKPASHNQERVFKQQLRTKLKEAGANEVLTYSFVHGELLKKAGIDADNWSYHIRNALSPDLQYYRPSLLPSLLAKIHPNNKAQAGSDTNEFALFEFGKAHVKGEFEKLEPTLPRQMKRLSFVYAADGKAAKSKTGATYYQAKMYVDMLTNGQATYLPLDTNEYPITAPFQLGRSAAVMVGDQLLGVVGEFRRSVAKSLKLPQVCAGFELDIELLQEHLQPRKYSTLSTFPESSQDVTFSVKHTVSWHQLEQLLHAELAVAGAENDYNYAIAPLTIYKPEDSEDKNVSFRITITHREKTLKTEEVTRLLNQIANAAHENLGAVRI
jgi:phenylalanyl-tRNA synthetase beta chain